MAIYLRSLAAFVLLLGLSAAAAAESMPDSSALESVAPSIHDILPLYGLPKGLFPTTVKNYSLTSNGEFEVELSAQCFVQLSKSSGFTDFLYYERHIKGKLSPRWIFDLSGINIKRVVMLPGLAPITSIVAHPADSTVAFHAGPLSQSLPVAQFAKIPDCLSEYGCLLPLSEV